MSDDFPKHLVKRLTSEGPFVFLYINEPDYAYKDLKAYAGFANSASTNQGRLNFGYFGTGTSETLNSIIHLYNFNSSSEYSSGITEDTNGNSTYDLKGQQGGFVHTVASASDGLSFYMSSGNIASGTLTLYKVV